MFEIARQVARFIAAAFLLVMAGISFVFGIFILIGLIRYAYKSTFVSSFRNRIFKKED